MVNFLARVISPQERQIISDLEAIVESATERRRITLFVRDPGGEFHGRAALRRIGDGGRKAGGEGRSQDIVNSIAA